MKIRSCFVSNSSSSSFCVYGFGSMAIDKFLNNVKPELLKKCKDTIISKYIEDGEIETEEEFEFCDEDNDFLLECIFEETNIKYNLDSGLIQCGVGISNMRDDETKKEFFNRVQAQFKSILKNPIKLSWIENVLE
jgi:hypothetical protein